MPLWFVVPPENPFRADNSADNFRTRTALGLEEMKRQLLRSRDCSFRDVIVKWNTTPQAMREWRDARSAEYEGLANASLENPMGPSLREVLSKRLEKKTSNTTIPEC